MGHGCPRSRSPNGWSIVTPTTSAHGSTPKVGMRTCRSSAIGPYTRPTYGRWATGDVPTSHRHTSHRVRLTVISLWTRLDGGLASSILLHPFLDAQKPGCFQVGQALRFCLSDLVRMKDV